jgi:hypothetical protein
VLKFEINWLALSALKTFFAKIWMGMMKEQPTEIFIACIPITNHTQEIKEE